MPNKNYPYDWGQAFLLSGCVGISLIVAMIISSLVGTVIPMFFHKIYHFNHFSVYNTTQKLHLDQTIHFIFLKLLEK